MSAGMTKSDVLRTQIPEILLVTKSPRRRNLMGYLGLPFTATHVETAEEHLDHLLDTPEKLVEHIVLEKVDAAQREFGSGRLLLCFDTLVVFRGEILGKPLDETDARAMLANLSGQTHQVITSMGILSPGDIEPTVETVVTTTTMNTLSQADIDAWLSKGEYRGCAGSYNIEAQIASVSDTECFQNVAGLPLCHLYHLLKNRFPADERLVNPEVRCNDELSRVCVFAQR